MAMNEVQIAEQMIRQLAGHVAMPQVFNPWRDEDPSLDVADAPALRRANLYDYLIARLERCRFILLAEALGYQGGRFSGIAMTSERLLLAPRQRTAREILAQGNGRRSSRVDLPIHAKVHGTTRKMGFAEPTATVVWRTLLANGVSPYEVILWNTLPFHPYEGQDALTNRTPEGAEFQHGHAYIQLLRAACPGAEFAAIGQHAEEALSRLGIPMVPIRHPAYGGVPDFTAQMNAWLGSK